MTLFSVSVNLFLIWFHQSHILRVWVIVLRNASKTEVCVINPLNYSSKLTDLCIHFQANGFNPSPVDMSNVVLPRELQVSIFFVTLLFCFSFKNQRILQMNARSKATFSAYEWVLWVKCTPEFVSLYLWCKGMVEVVAENYHNIWAKKKKSDLGSRGELLRKSIRDACCTKTRAVCVCTCW